MIPDNILRKLERILTKQFKFLRKEEEEDSRGNPKELLETERCPGNRDNFMRKSSLEEILNNPETYFLAEAGHFHWTPMCQRILDTIFLTNLLIKIPIVCRQRKTVELSIG